MKKEKNAPIITSEAGVTLVELIIVVAIMGVVLGSLVLSTGIIGKSRVSKAYNKLQSDYSTARNNTMSKTKASDLKIFLNGNYYYIQVGSEDAEKLITSNQSITFSVYSFNKETENVSFADMVSKQGSENQTVTLSFERSGALKAYAANSYISGIFIENKGIYITFETGKYSTEDLYKD
jgi:prepilin-type N-terminal cleavage/methylation domain-containing protein